MVDPFISRVALKNYKSIAVCNVRLSNLMFLVGRNAAGKSSFLDAIKFVADSLTHSLDHALRERGSIKEVRRRSGGHPTHFTIRLDFNIPDGPSGFYAFRIGSKSNEGYEVQEERCFFTDPNDLFKPHHYTIENGKVRESSILAPATVSDRLALVNYAGTSAFRPVFDALSRIEIYNLSPHAIAMPQKTDPSSQLRRDGSNAAGILRHVSVEDRNRLNELLGKIVPGIHDVETELVGSFETMQFHQTVKGARHAWDFPASSMSDGTLRSLGILLATMQSSESGPLLLGIEEPETAVHPAAARTLMESLRYAAERRQVLVTSHSPDLLDDPDLDASALLSVKSVEGTTSIGPMDEASRKMVSESLFTPGELLRQDQLDIEPSVVDKPPTDAQLNLFGEAR